MRTWLKNCKVTEIAMESTGQYWRALWNLLEGHFEKLLLVNPQHIKGLNGYKTDPKDALWIAGLLESGKLRGSFVPPREIRELRDVTRQRVHLLEDANRVKNRIEQLCQSGNIKVTSVASDLFGTSGRLMLKAIVEGKRDAGWMADYARGTLRGRKRELELALEGTFTVNQRWLLAREMWQLEAIERQVELVEREIERRVAGLEEPMRRLMTIPGIDRKTAWTIVSEIGVDMSVFGDARRLASWAGLCPGNRESGGKRMSGRIRKANRYVKRALCQAAWAASHTRNTVLSAFYRRIKVRKGAQKAIVALAHHMITVVYNVLARGEEYVEVGGDYYDRRNKTKVVHRMVTRLMRLGYNVSLTPVDPEPPAAAYASPEPEQDSITATAPISRKRGRPCKCAERGIICKHGRVPISHIVEPSQDSEIRFS
jgi:transposase